MLVLLSLLWMCALPSASGAGVDEPLRTGARAPGDVGLVVGLEDYAFVPDVPFAARDAQAFHDFLLYTHGVPIGRLSLITSGSHEAILSEAARLVDLVEPGATFWFYFAGHGAASPQDGERLLLADDVRQDPVLFAERAVALSALQDLVVEKGVKAAFVLDACYGGLGRGGQDLMGGQRILVPVSQRILPSDVFVWTAASGNELAAPYQPARHGAFTYFVLGALRGWADGELGGQRDGVVSPDEAVTYVQRALRTVGLRQTAEATGLMPPLPGQGRLAETGPSLTPAPALTVGVNPLTGGSLGQLQALRARQTAREAQVLELSQQLVEQASADWQATEEVAAAGGPEAELALRAFVERYGAASVTADDVDFPVVVAELSNARIALDQLQRGAPSDARRAARQRQMIHVAAGSFVAGSPPVEEGRSTDEVQVQTRLSRPFELGAVEVTQALYESVMGNNPSDCSVGCSPDLPVQNLSWLDAVRFCNQLSETEGLTAAYAIKGSRVSWDPQANGYRLPTEAEWEYAARAASSAAYGALSEPAQVCGVANVSNHSHGSSAAWVKHDRFPCDDTFEHLAPVASFEPNAWGLYDMLGNVSEWTWDVYVEGPLSGGLDPVQSRGGKERSVRGGSWTSLPTLTRMAARYGIPADSASFQRGFRVARFVD